MLSEEALERLSEKLVNRIEELNLFFIEELGTQLVDIGTLTPSQLRKVFQSVKYGNSLDKIIYKLSEVTDKNIKDIYDIFEEVAKKNQEYAKQFYKYRNIEYIPFDKNMELQEQVKSIANITAQEYMNMSNTIAYMQFDDVGNKVFTSVSKTYQKATDRAILSISQGRDSYEMMIKNTMKDLTSSGLRTVDYASGYSRRLDSSVRMNIMDGVRRLNRDLQERFGIEFNADGVEVSHHKNPAPDHEDTVDGEQFSNHGEVIVDGVKYADFDTINDSLKRHVGELNCYHFVYSIVLGVSKPMYSKKELEVSKMSNDKGFEFEDSHYTKYQGTQLQRKIETQIRKYKDRQIGAKAIGDKDEIYHCQEKIGQLTQKYNELSKVSGLPTKVDRLRVEGYSTIAIKQEDLCQYEDITQECLKNATPNSHEVLEKNYFIDNKNNKYIVDDKNVVLDYSENEKEVAQFLEKELGGEIYMLPRVNNPEGISTADYLFRNESLDLKCITGASKRAIDNAIKGKEKQSHNFIFDITKSDINRNDLLEQVKKIYNSKSRKWVEKVYVKDGDKLIAIYSRKKD